MKKLLVMLSIIVISLAIFGCSKTEPNPNVVDNLSKTGAVTVIEEEVDSAPAAQNETNEEKAADNESYEGLIKKLSEEKGLATAYNDTSSDSSAAAGTQEIIITGFVGVPSDITITVGATVIFTNKQPFKHIIGIRPKTEFNTWGRNINTYGIILIDQSYNFTFNQTGTYQWYSLSKYPTTSGEIIVK